MKTMSKLILPMLMLTAGVMMAQEKKSKVCIKIDKNENGVVTKVDTCYESSDPAEIDAFIKRMGVVENGTINVSGTSKSKKVMIVKNEDDTNGNKMEQSFSFTSDGDSSENVMVFVDDNGNVTTMGGEDAQVIIKQFDGDDANLDQEIEMLVNEATAGNASASNGTKHVVVFVSKKVEIIDVSSEDRKTMPKEVKSVKGNDFKGLEVYPNPSKGNFAVKYKENTNEPVIIKLYDAMGKEVLNMVEAGTNAEFDKTIDVSSLKKGIYFLHISQGKKAEVKKVVITE